MSPPTPVSPSSPRRATARSVLGILPLLGLVVGLPVAHAARCPDTSGFAAAATAVEAAVPCDSTVRHGKYVKDAKRALRATALRGPCRKAFVERFAKRSLCGRPAGRFEVCCRGKANGKDVSKVVRAGRCRNGQVCSGAPQSVGAGCTEAGACVTTTTTTTTTTTLAVCAPLSPILGPGQFGALLDAAEFADAPQALPVEAFRSTPASLPTVVVLGNLPEVAQQGTAANPGSPGSCEAQSFGYGLGSYTAARRPDGSIKWDPAEAEHSLSAAFLYELIQRQQRDAGLGCSGAPCRCPNGSLATPYLERLIASGAPSRAEVPYRADCCHLDSIDLDRPYPEATRFRIGSFATFNIANDPNVVERIKQYLWNGQVVAFSGLVPESYDTPTFIDGVLYEQETIPGSGHGQIIVGYDDTVGRPDLGLGAFLVQNSFGTGWPPRGSGSIAAPGRAFWSYETFVKTQLFAAVAYPVDPERPAVPPLASSIPEAPEAFVTHATQWASTSLAADVHLILQHHFAAPVVLEEVELQRQPTEASAEVSAPYANYIADGYSYFRRTDGRQFESGEYDVTLHAVTLDGARVTYTGAVFVGSAAPGTPPAAPVTADTAIFGTTGQAATIVLPFGPG